MQLPQLYHVSLQQEYWNDVSEPYTDQIASQVTPNPNVNCNRYIKFGVLKESLKQTHGISRLATGQFTRLWDRCETEESMPEYLERSLGNKGWITLQFLDRLCYASFRTEFSPLDGGQRSIGRSIVLFVSRTGKSIVQCMVSLEGLLQDHSSKTINGWD